MKHILHNVSHGDNWNTTGIFSPAEGAIPVATPPVICLQKQNNELHFLISFLQPVYKDPRGSDLTEDTIYRRTQSHSFSGSILNLTHMFMQPFRSRWTWVEEMSLWDALRCSSSPASTCPKPYLPVDSIQVKGQKTQATYMLPLEWPRPYQTRVISASDQGRICTRLGLELFAETECLNPADMELHRDKRRGKLKWDVEEWTNEMERFVLHKIGQREREREMRGEERRVRGREEKKRARREKSW